MYRNKEENITQKSNTETNVILGRRKDTLSEIHTMLDQIDQVIRIKSQKMRYQDELSKIAVEQINKLKHLRSNLKDDYHQTFMADRAKWEAIRSDIQKDFKQVKFELETL